MQIRMEREVNTGKFEQLTFEITLTDADVPSVNGDGPSKHMVRMQFQAYKAVLAFEAFHGVKTGEAVKAELERFKRAYGINGNGADKANGKAH